MAKRVAKDDPHYLEKLGEREGLSISKELYRENSKEFDAGRQLTVNEYLFLLRWSSDRLRKAGELPPKLSGDRLHVFEEAFYLVFRHKDML